jgi:hypothetical protein
MVSATAMHPAQHMDRTLASMSVVKDACAGIGSPQ